MRKDSFRDDREFNAVPDIHSSLEDKISYQRYLRKRWEAMTKPSDILYFPVPNGNWWCDPHGIDPEIIAQQQLRRLKRQMREVAC
jgi:hypothetical protein